MIPAPEPLIYTGVPTTRKAPSQSAADPVSIIPAKGTAGRLRRAAQT